MVMNNSEEKFLYCGRDSLFQQKEVVKKLERRAAYVLQNNP